MASRGLQIVTTFARHAFVSWRPGRLSRRAAFAMHMRLACQELGPAFIKLGQLVSVRPDIFGPDMVFEMSRLQDQVAHLPAATVSGVIENEFGRPVDSLFASFSDKPIGSASIAQVHRAVLAQEYRPVWGPVLPAGTVLAVKVVRPGVERAVRQDIEAARRAVNRLSGFARVRRYNLDGLLAEFEESMRSECDLRNEAEVADRFRFDFRDDDLLVVPRVVWPLTSRRVLTTEFITGWPLSEVGDAERSGVDGYGLALHGATLFMRQVLVVGRFHADLHPSNLFLTPEGKIAYLDFGIIGRTQPAQRIAIAQVLAATVYGDAERALRYSAQLGLVVPTQRERSVKTAVDMLMHETLTVAPRDIRSFAMGFLRIMNDEGVAVPVGFGLLVKALVTVEGVGRALYPEVDIVEAAKPFATRLIAQKMMSPERLAQRLPVAFRAAIKALAE